MLERLDTIVLKSDVLDLISADYGEIKGKLMSIADTVGASVDPAIATHVSGIVDKQVRKALASLKAIKKLTEREDGDETR
mgnify:CR=1 FL=1